MAIREGRWDCSSCGQVNLGRFEQCRSCGIGRGSDVAFYLPMGEAAISDADLIADAQSGRDWHCDHCDNSNKGSSDRCTSCGNQRDDEDKEHDAARDVIMTPGAEKPKAERPKARPDRPRRSTSADRTAHRPSASGSRPSKLKSFTPWLIASVFALIGILLVASFTVPFTAYGAVTDKSWHRSISIEQIKPIQDAGWDKPVGAYDVSSERKLRRHETVTVGYTSKTETSTERYQSGTETYVCGQQSMGNGYFQDRTCTRATYSTRPVTKTIQVPITEQRPVYDTWYEYTEGRWITVRTKASVGRDDEPHWAKYSLAPQVERVGSRSETYAVVLKIEEDVQTKRLSRQDWDGYQINDRLVLTTNFWGRVKSLTKYDQPER